MPFYHDHCLVNAIPIPWKEPGLVALSGSAKANRFNARSPFTDL
jgi:hypothetical protein